MQTLDLLIRDGTLVDGTGAPPRRADVGIAGDRIVAVGELASASARRIVAADGRCVTPGFIDIHSHSDIGILQDPTAENAVRQGMTLHVTGNCGVSPAPVVDATRHLAEQEFSHHDHPVAYTWSTFREYLKEVERSGVGVNVAPLVGHGNVRMAVLGYEQRPPSEEELDRMRAHVEEAMCAGAFGLSTGLVYPTGCFAETDEIIALASVAARHGGMYASHVRGERESVVDAVRECIEIGERSGCRTQISHNAPKYGGSHLLPDVMALWEAARDRGLDLAVDNDIHTDLGWPLRAGLPQWTHELDPDDLLALIASPERRRELVAETVEDRRPAYGPVGLLKHGVWDRVWLLPGPAIGEDAGRTIAEVAAREGTDGWTAYLERITATRGAAEGLFDYIDIDVIKAVARHPMVMLCSDGWVLPRGGNNASQPPYIPCAYGEFPGVIERFVVHEPVLSLEEAVRKMTSMPAARLGLADRGVVAPDMAADLVVFEPDRVRDRATNLFPHDPITEHYPHDFPEGIDWVLINGQVAVEEGEPTGVVGGRVLRSLSHRPA
jgi:N-acyl-D-amino-acid deacylase